MSIKLRLCLTFGVILLVMLSASVFYGVSTFRANSLKDIDNFLSSNAELKQKLLDEKMRTYFKFLELASKEIKVSKSREFNLENILATCANIAEQVNPIDVLFSLPDGTTYSHIRNGKIPNYNAREKKREWFIEIFDNKTTRLMTKPYVNSKKKLVMTIGVPIYNASTLVGSLCMSLDVESISNYIYSMSDNKNFFVTNSKGFIFAAKNKTDIGKNVFEIIPDFKEHINEEKASFDYTWKTLDDREYKVFSSRLSAINWTFWQYESHATINSESNSYLFHSILFLIIALIIAITATYFTAKFISTPINTTARILNILATQGNTNIDLDRSLTKRKDEIGNMADSLSGLIAILQEKAETAGKIAQGNLDLDAKIVSENDQLGIAFSAMIKDLNQILGQVNESVTHVASGVSQINISTQALSQGATEQASSLEEITSSMSEIGAQTTENASNSKESSKIANTTSELANSGYNYMKKLSESMTKISSNSQETKKVIKTIDDIAFQTNLLALNAAVEAARAGAHGKGFAVVAEEVRNLAARSSKAASETAELIEHSNSEIEQGVKVSEQTMASLESISENIMKTYTTTDEIAVASDEQARGIDEINKGLKQIESVTMQNTANAEETASASEEMAKQSHVLKNLISHFKLKSSSNPNTPAQKKIMNKPSEYIPDPSTVVTPEETIILNNTELDKF